MSYLTEFQDGTKFRGGDLIDSKWNKQPNKPIKKLSCTLFGITKELEGYQSYNYLMEKKTKIKSGAIIQSNIPTRIFILGKKDEKVDMWIFDLKTKKIEFETTILGMEYQNAPTTGWRS